MRRDRIRIFFMFLFSPFVFFFLFFFYQIRIVLWIGSITSMLVFHSSLFFFFSCEWAREISTHFIDGPSRRIQFESLNIVIKNLSSYFVPYFYWLQSLGKSFSSSPNEMPRTPVNQSHRSVAIWFQFLLSGNWISSYDEKKKKKNPNRFGFHPWICD